MRVDGTDVTALDEDGLALLRRDRVAFVFQTFGLIPVLSAAENVGVPLRLRAGTGPSASAGSQLLLDLVGLADARRSSGPTSCPGGQQQRVAIARALAARRGC